MAEDIYIEDYDFVPEPKQTTTKKKPDIEPIELKEADPDQKLTFADVLFGPKGVELQGDSFLQSGKLGRRIVERVKGEELTPIEDVDPFTGFVAGVVDGTIKIPYGVANITAEIVDALREEDVPVDKSAVAEVEKYFSNTVFGKIQEGAEDVVKESAIGKLTSALVQLYNFGKVGADLAVKGSLKAKQIYNKFSAGVKAGKAAKATGNATKAGIRAKELNKLSGLQKFAAVTVGGSTGSALVADIEDIGTWGDWLGGPSALDREQRKTAEDEAYRRLYNRFKFGAEGALVSVPIAYGTNLIAKRIAEA